MRIVDRENLAWCAGFWDGEGSCHGYKREGGYGRIVASISQVDREVLDKWVETIGFGSIRGPYKAKTENSRPYFVWSVEGYEKIQATMSLLWPWLGSVKRQQFIDQLEKYKLAMREKAITPRNYCSKGHELNEANRTSAPRGSVNGCRICYSESARIGWEKRRNG